MLLTTTENIPGKNYEILGIAKGSMIQTKNIGRDIGQGLKSMVGGELTTYTQMMNESRAIATKRMVEDAESMGADAIVMGDSLGQVASQTLRNIRSENIGLDFPVIRPLIGMDKLEIEAIAKEIGTYDISIRPTDGCTIVPVGPITNADPEKVARFGEKIDVDAIARRSAEAAHLI